MIKITLSKAINGFIIIGRFELNASSVVTKTAVFFNINNAVDCFKKLNNVVNSGMMTIDDFMIICEEYK